MFIKNDKLNFKLFSLFLAIIFVFSCSTNTFAMADNSKSVVSTVTEYQIYCNIKQKAKTFETLDLLSEDEKSIVDGAVERELLKRKEMSYSDLKTVYGYSDTQISILKNYNGEPIECSPQLAQVLSASLSLSVSGKSKKLGKSANCTFSWSWSSMPLVNFTDMISVGTVGVNSSSQNISLSFSSCSGTVNYYTSGNVYVGSYDTSLSFSYYNTNSQAKSKIQMTKSSTTNTLYAKTGTVKVSVKPSSSGGYLQKAYIAFAYGHTTVSVTPSVDISFNGLSASFSFGTNTQDAGSTNVEI